MIVEEKISKTLEFGQSERAELFLKSNMLDFFIERSSYHWQSLLVQLDCGL
jgi:hypothetical protein